MTTSNITHVTTAAATRFLTRRGYDIIEVNEGMIVATYDRELIFARVLFRNAADKGFPKENVTTRQEVELAAATWLANAPNDYTDYPVRFDVVAIIILSSERAFLRHNINAFESSDASEVKAS